MRGTYESEFAYNRNACIFKSMYGTRGARVAWFERSGESDKVDIYTSPGSSTVWDTVPINEIEIVPQNMIEKNALSDTWTLNMKVKSF